MATKIKLKRTKTPVTTDVESIVLDKGEPLFDANTNTLYVGHEDNGTKKDVRVDTARALDIEYINDTGENLATISFSDVDVPSDWNGYVYVGHRWRDDKATPKIMRYLFRTTDSDSADIDCKDVYCKKVHGNADTATESTTSQYLKTIAGNEIRFARSADWGGNNIVFGWSWADGGTDALPKSYTFQGNTGSGERGYVDIYARRLVGSADYPTGFTTNNTDTSWWKTHPDLANGTLITDWQEDTDSKRADVAWVKVDTTANMVVDGSVYVKGDNHNPVEVATVDGNVASADKVTTQIGNNNITDIFESDGKTAKKATNSELIQIANGATKKMYAISFINGNTLTFKSAGE